MKSELNISPILRKDFESFASEHVDEFKHVYMNFSKLLFIKDEELDKPVEIFEVSGHLKILLPEIKYIIVASETYNFLGINKNKYIYHVLKHIPINFTGEIVPHEQEQFKGEEKYD